MSRYKIPDEYGDYSYSNYSAGIINKLALFSTTLFIFLVPWGDAIYDGTPRLVATLALGLSFLLVITHGTHRNYSIFHFLIVIFVVWQLFSLMWSPTPGTEWGKEVAFRYIQLLLLAFVFSISIVNKSRINLAYQAYVFGNLAGSSVIFYHYINDIQFYYNRYSITEINPDGLAIYLALAIPMAAYLRTKYKNKLLKLINLAAIPLIFYAIFLTGTRTGSIVGIFGILYLLFTFRKSSVLIKSVAVVVFAVSIIMVISFAPKASVDRILSTKDSISTGTLNHRSVIWKSSIKQWGNSPIIGSGLGSLGYILGKEHVNYYEAHNAYIHILAENGLVGLLLYFTIIVFLFIALLKTPPDERSFLLTLLMILLVSQITTHMQATKIIWFVWTMIAIHSLKFSLVEK